MCYGNYNGKKDVGLFVHYLQANFSRDRKTRLYRSYIADCAKNINDCMVHWVGGSTMRNRYIEMIKPIIRETRTGKEVIEDISNKLEMLGGE